ncbi:MAG: nucleotidyltransferase [Bacillus sp. (in: firmicutes)]|jgi:hypothetical protein|nr:nucleotidyltransferase [Sphingobacterium sp.]MDF2535434.1 nucleotidyltransferase [Bacillales bacterium]MDF2903186.1 nucleotidyltransferase [Bacillus sp. (in: firmicutes)]
MADIQKQFEKFHDEIKLKRFIENKTLREKRDIIINKIKNGVKSHFEEQDEDVPELEFIDQGSYSVDLGIIPENNNYDIDEGIIFHLYKEDYPDGVQFKKLIRDIMKNHTHTPPKIKNPCVTITYSLDDEPIYHVDLPVYIKTKQNSSVFLARGKEFSEKKNKYWELADPQGLKTYISSPIAALTDDDKKQFKRIVRYMKKWKDICFFDDSTSRPPSVGISVFADQLFAPSKKHDYLEDKDKYCDLDALKSFTYNLKDKFVPKWNYEREKYLYVISLNLPVAPCTDIFCKMTDIQMNAFYEKLNDFDEALAKAQSLTDPHDACKDLPKFLGDKFPVPESVSSRYKKVGLSSAPSSNSAKD